MILSFGGPLRTGTRTGGSDIQDWVLTFVSRYPVTLFNQIIKPRHFFGGKKFFAYFFLNFSILWYPKIFRTFVWPMVTRFSGIPDILLTNYWQTIFFLRFSATLHFYDLFHSQRFYKTSSEGWMCTISISNSWRDCLYRSSQFPSWNFFALLIKWFCFLWWTRVGGNMMKDSCFRTKVKSSLWWSTLNSVIPRCS